MKVQLLERMMKSKESLEWVCEAIMNNEKIPAYVKDKYAPYVESNPVITFREVD